VPIDELLLDPFSEGAVQARRKCIALTKNIEASLPLVLADKNKICRVVSNLLRNAFNHTAEGGSVRIDAHLMDGFRAPSWPGQVGATHAEGLAAFAESRRDSGNPTFVKIAVKDTGKGIPPEDLSYVFDPYWRSDSKDVGTGLGLAVVKRIVTAHGGIVAVRSREGEGSEFSSTLPAAASNGAETDSTSQPPQALRASTSA